MISEKLNQIEVIVKDTELYLSKIDKDSLNLSTITHDLIGFHVKVSNILDELIKLKKEK
jgi:hypothetical protein